MSADYRRKKKIKKKEKVVRSRFSGYPHNIFIFFILIFTFVLYKQILKGEFLSWDDKDVIVNNEAIRNLNIENIKTFFTSTYSGDYRPLTFLFFSLIYSFTALEPWGYHIFSILFHLLNIVLVYVLLNLLLKNKKGSMLGCIVFAIHPMFVEPVAWVSAFNDVLCTAFFLTSLIFYTVYLQKKLKPNYFILCLLFYILAVLSKPTSIVLPALLFLFDYYFKRELSFKIFYEKIPFFLLSLAIIAISIIGRLTDITISSAQFSFFDRMFFPFYSLLFYLIKFILPVNLSAFYDYPYKINNLLPIVYYVSPLLIVLIGIIIYRSRFIKRELIFGFLFFLINLLPVIHIIPFSKSIVSDRYSYTAYFGLIFILVAFYYYMGNNKNKYVQFLNKNFKAFILLLFVFYSVCTFSRVGVWQNSITLWQDVIDKRPRAAIAYHNLAFHYQKTGDLYKAIDLINKAIQLDSSVAESFVDRGNFKSDLNDHNEAISDYSKAIKIKPNYADAFNNRGVAKSYTKDFKGAISDYTKAIEIKSDYADAFNNRGNAKNDIGDKEGAFKDYTQSIIINNKNYAAYFNRGLINMKLNNYESAINDFDNVSKINSTLPDAYLNKGVCYLNLRQKDNACYNLKKAIDLKHSEASYYFDKYCK